MGKWGTLLCMHFASLARHLPHTIEALRAKLHHKPVDLTPLALCCGCLPLPRLVCSNKQVQLEGSDTVAMQYAFKA